MELEYMSSSCARASEYNLSQRGVLSYEDQTRMLLPGFQHQGVISLLVSRHGVRRAERQTGPRGRTYLHLRKSSCPSAGGLICNSISHNVISLAFTHLADTDNQARCIMKYRTHRRPSDLSHLAFSPSLTQDGKGMTFILRGSRCIAFCVLAEKEDARAFWRYRSQEQVLSLCFACG